MSKSEMSDVCVCVCVCVHACVRVCVYIHTYICLFTGAQHLGGPGLLFSSSFGADPRGP